MRFNCIINIDNVQKNEETGEEKIVSTTTTEALYFGKQIYARTGEGYAMIDANCYIVPKDTQCKLGDTINNQPIRSMIRHKSPYTNTEFLEIYTWL